MSARPLARRLAVLAALGLALAGCGLPQRYHAAGDVRAFLQAVQGGDEAAFEAHIDRPALRRQLLGQADAAIGQGALAALLGGRASEDLADQLITPQTFQAVWRRSGLPADRIPSAPEIAALLRMEGPGQACLHDFKRGRCVLTFRNEGGTFRLAEVAGRLGP